MKTGIAKKPLNKGFLVDINLCFWYNICMKKTDELSSLLSSLTDDQRQMLMSILSAKDQIVSEKDNVILEKEQIISKKDSEIKEWKERAMHLEEESIHHIHEQMLYPLDFKADRDKIIGHGETQDHCKEWFYDR